MSPVAPVQVAIANSLGYVRRRDILAALIVGDGAGHLEDAVVSAGREVELGHGFLQ